MTPTPLTASIPSAETAPALDNPTARESTTAPALDKPTARESTTAPALDEPTARASTTAPALDEPTARASTTATTPDETVQQLIRQLYGFGAVRRALGKAAHREIASQGFAALGAIYRTGPCRVSDIAAALQVDLSVASRQIAALVSAEHVERRADPEDGRAHLLHLTDAGRGALSRAHDGMVDVLSDALADWSRSDVETLAQGLERLIDAFTTPPSSDQEVSA